jgi:release factor glutamine methyltransferase
MSNENLTFLEVIQLSTDYLNRKGVPNSKVDTEWIVSSVTGKKRIELYLQFEDLVDGGELSEIRNLIVARGKRIPLQHILGKINFAGNEMLCDDRALIPRPETEYLTELVIKKLGKNFNGSILDLGTGSGAIILALCKTLKSARGIGLDKSQNAISLSKENLKLNNIKNVSFEKLDWYSDKIEDSFDVIISNPPYLSEEEWANAEPEVKKFDPKTALVANQNGIADLKKIIKIGGQNLKKGGGLFLEIGTDQKNELKENLSHNFENIEILKDLSNYDRFIFAKRI